MRIDVHWHHVPRSLVEAVVDGTCPIKGHLEGEGDDAKIILESGFRQELPAELTDPARAVAHMDEVGLDIVAPAVAPPLMHHDADVATATRFSQFVNDGLAEAADQYGDRFRPLANLPMQDAEAAAAELKRAMSDLGFVGAQISTHVFGRNLGDDEFRPFWRAVADLDAFIFLHPSPPPLGAKDRLNRHGLANFVGLPIDTAAAVASLMFDGVYEEVGPLKTCFAHGGGACPYILSRWEHGYHARLAPKNPPMKNPYSYLESLYCDTLTHSEAALRFLVEVLGPEHVCLGSDYPFDMGEPDPNGAMERAISDPAVREQIGSGTAAKLLGIEAAKGV